jgi:hypothetical protein
MLKRFSANYVLFSLFMDATCVVGAFLLGMYLRTTLPYGLVPLHPDGMLSLPFFPIAVLLWVVVAFGASLYDPRNTCKATDEYQTLMVAAGFFSLAVAGVLYFAFRDTSRLLVLYALVALWVALAVWRAVARIVFRLGKSPAVRRRVLIVGAGKIGQQVAEMVQEYAWTGLELVGYLDDDPAKRENGLPVLGTLNEARQVIESRGVDEVVVALPRRAHARLNQLVTTLHELPVHARVVPDYFALALYRAAAEDFAGIPMIDLRAPALSEYQRLAKRLFDLTAGGVSTLLSLPVMGLVALAIKLDSRGPVFFRQRRVGEDVQVPFHGLRGGADAGPDQRGGRGGARHPQEAGRPSGDSRGALHPPHQPGRVAPVVQRAERGHEPGGAAPGIALAGGGIRSLATQAVCRAAGYHWLVAGERAQRQADAPEHRG